MGDANADVTGPWPTTLEENAKLLLLGMQAKIDLARVKYLDLEGFTARHALWAARNRIITMLTGVRDKVDDVVVARMVEVAMSQSPAPADPPSPQLDDLLIKAIQSWRNLDSVQMWQTLEEYVKASSVVSVAEQLLLLTYLEILLNPPTAAEMSSAMDLAATVAQLSRNTIMDLYGQCVLLANGGSPLGKSAQVQAALMAVAILSEIPITG